MYLYECNNGQECWVHVIGGPRFVCDGSFVALWAHAFRKAKSADCSTCKAAGSGAAQKSAKSEPS
jgi:hypothetical protein